MICDLYQSRKAELPSPPLSKHSKTGKTFTINHEAELNIKKCREIIRLPPLQDTCYVQYDVQALCSELNIYICRTGHGISCCHESVLSILMANPESQVFLLARLAVAQGTGMTVWLSHHFGPDCSIWGTIAIKSFTFTGLCPRRPGFTSLSSDQEWRGICFFFNNKCKYMKWCNLSHERHYVSDVRSFSAVLCFYCISKCKHVHMLIWDDEHKTC